MPFRGQLVINGTMVHSGMSPRIFASCVIQNDCKKSGSLFITVREMFFMVSILPALILIS